MKKVLILGAGMVAKPIVDYLLDSRKIFVIVASRTVKKAQAILQGRKNTKEIALLVEKDDELEKVIKSADIVVSLLPYTYHVKTAQYCLKHRIPLVTTSYVSPQMKELDQEAQAKGILLLNEIGLDPGIDHMSAMKIINDVQTRGGKIMSFRSYCGGLPAPEANTNPWNYKFSWSPRGVLMAGRNDAKFLQDGAVIEIEGKNLFKNHWPIHIDHLDLETYPNRNSLPYTDLYGIQDTRTMYRGTLRYPGWCRTLLAVSRLSLLTDMEITGVKGLSHKAVFQKVLGDVKDPVGHICGVLDIQKSDEIISKLEWLGLMSDSIFDQDKTTPIDFLSALMVKKMEYKTGERDMIVLHHEFIGEFREGNEKITSTLIDYGIPKGSSAMSRTVSLPAAIAVKLVLEGRIQEKGVRIPVDPEIYLPVLEELEQLGIVCLEKSTGLVSKTISRG